MESLWTVGIFVALLAIIALPYWIRASRRRKDATATWKKNAKAGTLQPVTLHPKINLETCIGCASCVRVCPEGVLGIIDGRAAIVSGTKCIGHGLCADVCPVGAINLGFGAPRQGMEIPYYDQNYEANIPGLYIVGELGGMGLIKNAVSQGVKAIEHIAGKGMKAPARGHDVIIVGAGPAGLAAALSCKAKGLRYVVLEQDEIGGTALHYPRKKLVLTSPVDLPLYGKLKVSEIRKEELLTLWTDIVQKFTLNILTHHKVETIDKAADYFTVRAGGETFVSSSVVLAIGRRGSPKKLGVQGEDLSKVMYKLIEAESYNDNHLLVVGGGDSAVEAAIGLASQKGNRVTLSYRREDFVRLKEKNEQRIREFMANGRVKPVFNSSVVEIKPDTVLLQEGEKIIHNVPNEYLFVFAGGELPTELLKKAGVKLRTNDVEVMAA